LTGSDTTNIYIGSRNSFNPATTGVPSEYSHTAIGFGALNNFSLGDRNTVIGRAALQSMATGSDNLAVGAFAGEGLQVGDKNFFVGTGAGSNLQIGSENFFLGQAAGNQFRSGSGNILIGSATGFQFVTGSGCLFFAGSGYGEKVADNVDNQFAVTYGKSGNTIQLFYKSGSQSDNLYLYGGLEVQNTLTASAVLSTGNITIQSGSGDLFVHGHKQFNVGDFWSTVTQSGSAGVSGSVTFNNTGTSEGVSVVSNSELTIANAGVYSITFSAQIKADGGQDTIWMWLKKNGTNVADTATKLIAKNGEESVMTVEWIVNAAANDYYEIAWQNLNGYADLLYEGASGNIPAIPSIIASVKQCR